MKTHFKKALAILCCLAISVTAVSVMTFSSLAEGEYFVITESNRNLFINVDQEIALEDIAVFLGGTMLQGKDVTWTGSDDAVRVVGGVLVASAKGAFPLTVEDADGNTGTVTVITKNAEETEYVLYEEDFSGVADGALPEGWTVSVNGDVTDDDSLKHATYVDEPQVKDGVLYMGNGVVSGGNTYVYLPESLDSFGDYQVELNAKQSYVFNNVQGSGVVLRADRTTTEAGLPASGYRVTFLRSQSGNTALGIYDLANSDQKVTGSGVFPIGSTRNWSRPDWTENHPSGTPSPWYTPAETTNWRPEGYDMTYLIALGGTDFSLDYYRSYEQPQFGGDMGPNNGDWWETYFLDGDPALEGHELEANLSEWTNLRETGAVALMTCASQLAVDSIRVTVPAAVLPANPNNYEAAQLDPSLAEYQDQKIGVMSDLHVATHATDADTTIRVALNKMKNEGVSAVLITGDVATTGLPEEYAKFMSIWNSVFTDQATAPALLAITGNHEFEQAYYKRETVEDVYAHYMEAYGYDEVNFHKVINGIHILGINSETAAVHGGYTLETTAWLEEELAAAKADDPYAPIIVMVHQTLKNTTYGSLWGSSNTGSLYEVLSAYPQVIYLAGHSHFASENEKCIMQKDFTTVDVPSMQYTSVENGSGGHYAPADAFESQGFLMLEFKSADKMLDIHRYKINKRTEETFEIKTPWSLPLPITRKNFCYKADRIEDRTAPTFASDAAVTVTDVSSNSASITFPAASHDDYVHAYNVVVTDSAGSLLLTKYLVSDFYVVGEKKTEFAVDLEGLPSNSKVIINVTAMESFGLTSEPITTEVTTEPISTPSKAENVADFFDVNTAVGFEDNSPYRRQYNVYVKSHPIRLIQDETLGRQVAYMGGWVNYPTSQGSLKEITDSFTVEVAFKSPAEEITGSQCLFGNPESGGLTVEYTADGVFQAGAHIDGGYKYVQIPDLEPDTWYHMVYTFDGNQSVVYIDGEKAGETESVGSVYFNPTVNFLTIGANVNASGNAAYVFDGHIAVARVYTKAMSASEAADAYDAFTNDNFRNALYQKYLALYNLDTEGMAEEDVAAINNLMDKALTLLDNPDLTEEEANGCIDEINDLLISLMKYDPKAPLVQFFDPFDDFTKVADKSDEGLQWENNTEIKKTLFSKNKNVDVYITYELPGYIRAVELDALSVYTEYNFGEDFKFFVSKDGVDWVELPYTFSEPVENAVTPYWMESTVSTATNGEYTFLKVQLNEFGTYIDPDTGDELNRCNWSTVMDGLRVWYAERDLDIPDIPIDPDEPINPDEPIDPNEPVDNLDEPPAAGDDGRGMMVALVLLTASAMVITVIYRKRVRK